VFSPARKSAAQAGQGNVLKLAEISYRQELPMAHLPRSAGTWQALFQLAQSFFDEAQHVEAVEYLAIAKRRPRVNHLQRDAGAFQLFARLGRRRFHSGRWPAMRRSCGDTGRTAREQVRHFRARLSTTPVAPWAA
jgi:hypothetical protein